MFYDNAFTKDIKNIKNILLFFHQLNMFFIIFLSLLIIKVFILLTYTGLQHTQGIQGNSGNFQV